MAVDEYKVNGKDNDGQEVKLIFKKKLKDDKHKDDPPVVLIEHCKQP